MSARIIRRVAALALALGAMAPALAHQGHTHEAAWTACDAKALGDACVWLDKAHARYVGTCREVSARYMCVRNRPIEPPPTAWRRVWQMLRGIAPGA